ncbi:hypothetical protein L4L00_001016 [Salmonella enterica]|nr:hypothetical protein [Salmonella enterica subsp. enterica serovar Pomona]EEU6435140.1 hypothetical protein [Salmonella enterica]EIJ8479588.1 hypothetical protein [Salmonella enterica]EIM9913663.1 hypothetical protein [Salmonella enterica]EIT0240969.1 hypothetical protein [Salmonella enterica]
MDSNLVFSIGVSIVIVMGALLNVLYSYKRKNSAILIVFLGIITAFLSTFLLKHFGIINGVMVSFGGILSAFLSTACVLTVDKTFGNIITEIKSYKNKESIYHKHK